MSTGAARAPLTAQTTSRAATRSLIGDVAVEIRDAPGSSLAIGLAGARHAVTLTVRASDARRWADSAGRLIASTARRARRRTASPKGRDTGTSLDHVMRWRAVLEEPGVGAGSLVLARTDSAGRSFFVLFAADANLDEVREPLETTDAAALVAVVRRRAVAATPTPRRRPRPPRAPEPKRPPRAATATSSSPLSPGPIPGRASHGSLHP